MGSWRFRCLQTECLVISDILKLNCLTEEQWTVMIRSVDRTGWVSDNQAAIVINFGDAIPTNVVETFEAHTDGWPGQKVNMEVFTGLPYSNAALLCETPTGTLIPSDVINVATDSICTDAPGYDSPEFDPGVVAFDDANALPRNDINLGQGDLVQIDPTQDGFYYYPFEVLAGDSGILITTISTGTYQWFVRRIGDDTNKPMYPDPQGDPMYPRSSDRLHVPGHQFTAWNPVSPIRAVRET